MKPEYASLEELEMLALSLAMAATSFIAMVGPFGVRGIDAPVGLIDVLIAGTWVKLLGIRIIRRQPLGLIVLLGVVGSLVNSVFVLSRAFHALGPG